MADPQLEEAFIEQFEQDGTMDWIREQAGLAQDSPAPEEESSDTVEAPEEPELEEVAEELTEEVEPEGEVSEPEAEPEEGLFLDMTPEMEEYLAKYGGDISKALQAAQEAQSLIGRQGSELGELRKVMEERDENIMQQLQAFQSQRQLDWPDEDEEPEEAVQKYQAIADQSFMAEDLQSFVRALESWQEVDPLGANAYRMLKQAEVRLGNMAPQEPEDQSEEVLVSGMEMIKEKYPAIQTEEFQNQLNNEAQKFPSLGALMRGEIPGVTSEERIAALDELSGRIASRQTDETTRKAMRRVAVSTSEEARKARAEARVAQSGSRGRPVVEDEDEQIKLGKTNVSVSKNKLTADIKRLSGMDVQIGE